MDFPLSAAIRSSISFVLLLIPTVVRGSFGAFGFMALAAAPFLPASDRNWLSVFFMVLLPFVWPLVYYWCVGVVNSNR